MDFMTFEKAGFYRHISRDDNVADALRGQLGLRWMRKTANYRV